MAKTPVAGTHPPGPPPPPPPPPPGPRPPAGPGRVIVPLDPDSPEGRAAAEALSQVLAEIQLAIWRRERAAA